MTTSNGSRANGSIDKRAREKRFSVGWFDRDYVLSQPIAVLKLDGRIVAFANVLLTETRAEASIDLMRFGIAAPRSAMEFLLIKLMLHLRDQGYRSFNLGMAPLSGRSRVRRPRSGTASAASSSSTANATTISGAFARSSRSSIRTGSPLPRRVGRALARSRPRRRLPAHRRWPQGSCRKVTPRLIHRLAAPAAVLACALFSPVAAQAAKGDKPVVIELPAAKAVRRRSS